jgi:hypothetical protein
MTLPEMKRGRVRSGAPGVRVDGALREEALDEFVEPPRCAVANGASKAIASAIRVLDRKERSSIAASWESLQNLQKRFTATNKRNGTPFGFRWGENLT